MNRQDILKSAEEFAKQRMAGFDSGHDWYHIERVRKLAVYINDKEKLVDPFALDLAVLLHDTADSKFNKDNQENGYKILEEFMKSAGLDEIIDQVINAIRSVSFSNKKTYDGEKDPLLMVLQDADRLDAIGAIGIARAFNYGGFRNNAIYIPGEISDGKSKSTIGHFYDKLLKLKDLMNTETGRKLAEERHLYLENFLKQFYSDWDFGVGLQESEKLQ
ncbi:MAG: HD domain-containing protein [Bacteroidales bacterium]|nr:HD domain-containing protein [Bacteroidales bacterium]MBK7627656.1 HD domain-containing protein [Bacteroidales bacterium]